MEGHEEAERDRDRRAEAHVVEPPEAREQHRHAAREQRAAETEIEAEQRPAELAPSEGARAQVAAREQREQRRDQRHVAEQGQRLPDRGEPRRSEHPARQRGAVQHEDPGRPAREAALARRLLREEQEAPRALGSGEGRRDHQRGEGDGVVDRPVAGEGVPRHAVGEAREQERARRRRAARAAEGEAADRGEGERHQRGPPGQQHRLEAQHGVLLAPRALDAQRDAVLVVRLLEEQRDQRVAPAAARVLRSDREHAIARAQRVGSGRRLRPDLAHERRLARLGGAEGRRHPADASCRQALQVEQEAARPDPGDQHQQDAIRPLEPPHRARSPRRASAPSARPANAASCGRSPTRWYGVDARERRTSPCSTAEPPYPEASTMRPCGSTSAE